MGLITRIKFDNGVKNINHSQFADNTLLIGGASNIIARRFKTLLDNYMSYSRGLIYYLKSCIYGWNTSAHVLHRIARTLGVPCKLNWEQFTYLGMHVSVGNLKATAWEVIIDKMKRKIQHWGTSWLNPAGHIILLKAGLSSLPLYCFTLLQAPTNFHFKMDALLHHFLWQGGRNEKKKYNLVSWKQVTQPCQNGGLGIRSSKFLNLAFAGKLVWRLITGRNAWWKTVLEKKYLNHPRHQLLDHELPNRACSKIWRMCKQAIPFLDQNTSKVPKGGSYIRIGEDKIMGQQPISQRPGTQQILALFSSAGIQTLAQISQWEAHSHT